MVINIHVVIYEIIPLENCVLRQKLSFVNFEM